MAREVKREIIKVRVRSGWPEKLNDDLEYFNITIKALSEESHVSRTRIGYITKGIANWDNFIAKLTELNTLTLAFNRIISNRTRKAAAHAWVWEK